MHYDQYYEEYETEGKELYDLWRPNGSAFWYELTPLDRSRWRELGKHVQERVEDAAWNARMAASQY